MKFKTIIAELGLSAFTAYFVVLFYMDDIDVDDRLSVFGIVTLSVFVLCLILSFIYIKFLRDDDYKKVDYNKIMAEFKTTPKSKSKTETDTKREKMPLYSDKDPLADDIARWIVKNRDFNKEKIQRQFYIGPHQLERIFKYLERIGVLSKEYYLKERKILIRNNWELEQLLESLYI